MNCLLTQANELKEDGSDGETISAVEYNQVGDMVAVGNRRGQIFVFKQTKSQDSHYSLYSGFQSHEHEFDCLKSVVIEARINSIAWLPQPNNSRFLLSSNDKCIKLWKMSEKHMKYYGLDEDDGPLKFPKVTLGDKIVENVPKRIFSSAHLFQINSVRVNTDMETFISSDDLRINLWHIESSTRALNVVDLRPFFNDNVAEVITCCQFHPTMQNTFIYGTTRGLVKLCDMRRKALCDQYTKMFSDNSKLNCSIYDEITNSLSDVTFSRCGKFLMARDFLTVKIWDLSMENRPLYVYKVSDSVKSKLHFLYQNDAIYDKFQLSTSFNDRFLLTGTYNNYFRLYDRKNNKDSIYQANINGLCKSSLSKSVKAAITPFRKRKEESSAIEGPLNVDSKIALCSFSPVEDEFVLSSGSTLFFYQNFSK